MRLAECAKWDSIEKALEKLWRRTTGTKVLLSMLCWVERNNKIHACVVLQHSPLLLCLLRVVDQFKIVL